MNNSCVQCYSMFLSSFGLTDGGPCVVKSSNPSQGHGGLFLGRSPGSLLLMGWSPGCVDSVGLHGCLWFCHLWTTNTHHHDWGGDCSAPSSCYSRRFVGISGSVGVDVRRFALCAFGAKLRMGWLFPQPHRLELDLSSCDCPNFEYTLILAKTPWLEKTIAIVWTPNETPELVKCMSNDLKDFERMSSENVNRHAFASAGRTKKKVILGFSFCRVGWSDHYGLNLCSTFSQHFSALSVQREETIDMAGGPRSASTFISGEWHEAVWGGLNPVDARDVGNLY